MARCYAKIGPGKQCHNHSLSDETLCQTHYKMLIQPKKVSAQDYISSVPPRTSTKGHQVSINSGHKRLMTKARKKFQEGDTRSASQLAHRFGGERNWWAKVVIYGTNTPRYLQDTSAEQLRRYIDEPTTAEPLGVMDEIGPAAQEEDTKYQDSVPLELTGPSLKELHDAWLKSQEPEEVEVPDSLLADEVTLLFQRTVALETMMGQVFTHLLGTGRS